MLSKGSNASEIKEIALKQGMKTMGYDGMVKVREGRSTIMEILRCVDISG